MVLRCSYGAYICCHTCKVMSIERWSIAVTCTYIGCHWLMDFAIPTVPTLIVKIKGGGLTKSLTLGTIYRHPRTRNDDLNSFINEFAYIISSLGNINSHFILAGDFNINLLKLNENDSYSNVCKLCKSVLESTAGIPTKIFSDHQPYFMMLNSNQKTNPPPKFIKKYNTSDEAMLNVRNEIQSEELYSKLCKSCTADINLNYEMINDEILRANNKHMPCKLVKFNKYKHKNLPGSRNDC